MTRGPLALSAAMLTCIGLLAPAAQLSPVGGQPAARVTPRPAPPPELPGTDDPGDNNLAQLGSSTDPGAGYLAALAQAGQNARRTAASNPDLANRGWKFAGPVNIGGRVTSVAVDAAHAGTVYIATASGGVWKSTDTGMTFSTAWPIEQTQAIGAIAIASDGTLFAGTGEAGPGGGSLTYGGNGIYRSRDGGITWTAVGLGTSGAIARIAVDPKNPKRILVAALGNLYVPGGQRGVYQSLDGGDTWRLSLPGANATTGAADVEIDPAQPSHLFAGMWDHLRTPSQRVYGGPGSGAYRSMDGGSTWQQMDLSTTVTPAHRGRVDVAVAPTDSNRVYVKLTDSEGQFDGFFISTDGGTTFTVSNDSLLASSQSSYGWWFGRITVSPVSADQVFTGGVNLMESINGGMSWAPIDGAGQAVHADQHDIVFDPGLPTRVFVASDGGLYTSSNLGQSYTHASSEPFTQFSSMDVSQQDSTRIVGGAQDNGALRSYGSADWNAYGGGDGQRTLVNPRNDMIVYGCSQYGACTVSSDGGQTNNSLGTTVSGRHNWLTPMEFDPLDPSIVYYAGNQLNRSSDNGSSFTVISPDLTGGRGPDKIYPNFGTITTISAGPAAGGYIIIGTDDGRIQFSSNGGKSWTRSTDPHLPNAWVTRVAIDFSHPATIYASFSGYRNGSAAANVLRSDDAGTSWKDISGGLPAAPVNKVLPFGGGVLAGSDVGVYLSADGHGAWQRVGNGLPQAPVEDLRFHAATEQLFAATFGRGIWAVPLSPSTATPAPTASPGSTPGPTPGRPMLPNTSAGGRPPRVAAFLVLLLGLRLLRRRQPHAVKSTF
ncbi:MAG: WD40/YVTN/BNR-like repeat-containing protein [Candidatus Dormibacteria bacterium]